MKPRKRAVGQAATARPRSLRDEIPEEASEEGLSIDPEQLGESFLRYATEQGKTGRRGVPELRPDGAPASDESLEGSHFSTEASIWENTASMLREREEDTDDVTGEPPPPELLEGEEDERLERGVAEVDLTESVIDEASLLDEESDVLGETVPKEPRTDDSAPRRPSRF